MTIQRKNDDRALAIHPGEFLREDFMVPLGLSASALAKALHVPTSRITAVTRERRGITADTALRLAQYFGTTPDFWMNMQKQWELAIAEKQSHRRIRSEVKPAPRNPKTGEIAYKESA